MLSVNYIANYLDKNQININNEKYILKNFEINCEKKDTIDKKIRIFNEEKKESYNDLYDCFNIYFEKDMFGMNKIINKNKNKIYTFFSSIFGIGDENYYLMKEDEKIKAIKNLIHKLDNDIFSMNYYNIFRYDKNKYFSKEKISSVLKEAFSLRVNENFNLLIKYLVDYLGINIIIFELKNKEIINNYKINSNKYTENYNKYLPNYFIMIEDDEFKPIMIKNKICKNYIEFEDNYKIIDRIEDIKNYMSIENASTTKPTTVSTIVNSNNKINLKKMKIDELRNYCVDNSIDIHKTSEKTGKQIKKTKDELLNELDKINQ